MKPASHIDIPRFLNRHPQYKCIAPELKALARSKAKNNECDFFHAGNGYPYKFKEVDLCLWALQLAGEDTTPVAKELPAVIKYAYVEHNSAYYVYTINGIAMKLFAKFVYQQDAEHYCNLMNSLPASDVNA